MSFIHEDDDNIRKLISYSLTSQNFQIQDFALPSAFWTALENCHPDLLLLDVMLPQEDGISILKKLRSNPKTSGIPVIMLTAKDSEYDVVTDLDASADDYVTKPFGMLPLVSRIKTVLRRYEKPDNHMELLQVGDLKFDENQHTVFYNSQQLLEHIWDISADVESRTVNVHIRTLRQKLGDAGNAIETIRGIGYKFN